MRGPVYWHPALYAAAMKRLYGRDGFAERYTEVARHIPPGTEVVDLCAGDGLLRHHLDPSCHYTAVDMNAPFMRKLRAAGVDAVVADLNGPLPTADVVVMMAALYHFMPNHVDVVRRARAAARQRFILTEPVENVAASRSGLLRRVASWASDPGNGTSAQRLGIADLESVLEAVPGGRVVHRAREWVLVWDTPERGR